MRNLKLIPSKSMQRLLSAVTCAVIVFVLFTGCSERDDGISVTVVSMDTHVTITIYDKKEWTLIDRCIELINEYELIFSRISENSELHRVNAELESRGYSEVSGELSELLTLSGGFYKMTGRAFDPTIGAVSRLWDFVSENPVVPDLDEVAKTLELVGYSEIEVTDSTVTAPIGTVLDFGASAKGYIADRLREFLVSEGVNSAIINLGGDIMCIGKRVDGSDFSIGVRKPFGESGELYAVLSIDDCSVVTSGVYERYFYSGSELFHHILDPETGFPANTGLQSVTVISQSSALGDALGTACLVLGPERSLELIDSIGGVFAMFILDDGSVLFSESFERLTNAQIINSEVPEDEQ